jgi:hypothetical protein
VSLIRPLAVVLLLFFPAAASAQFIGPGNNQSAQAQQGQQNQQQPRQNQAQQQPNQQQQRQQPNQQQRTQSPRGQTQQGQGQQSGGQQGQQQEQRQGGTLRYMGQLRGPYKGTSIIKMRDSENGVTCYVYAPTSIPYRTPMRGGVSYGSNSVGSISCVK